MHIEAPAKLNLSLAVGAKRADGYHALSSAVGFVDICDQIHLSPSDAITLSVSGPFAADSGPDEDNLVVRAAESLARALEVSAGVHIALEKNIPVGAGLGGGSADAAAILRALPGFWSILCPSETQQQIAKSLGADVPVCLNPSGLWLMEGIGHDVSPIQAHMSDAWAVLVYPNAPTATKSVYAAYTLLSASSKRPTVFPDWANVNQHGLWPMLHESKNVLQLAAISVTREITEVMLALECALPEPALVRMSGSGACCFALYHEKSQALRLASSLAAEHPNWWVQPCCFR